MKKFGIFLLLIAALIACGEAPATNLDPIEPLPESGDNADSLNQTDTAVSTTSTSVPASSETVSEEGAPVTSDEPQPPENGEATAPAEESNIESAVDPANEAKAAVAATPEPIVEETMVEVVAEFESQLDEALKAESGSDLAFGGFETVETRSISMVDGSELLVSYSVGFRPFEPLQNHFVLLTQPAENGWIELGRIELDFPDIMFPDSLTLLEENGRLWLQVASGVGAHGGCYDALLWDGTALTSSISHCHSSPAGAGKLEDLNGDGQIDALLNNTNDYIFCYACSVRLPSYEVRTFNGSFWETKSLATIETGDETAVNLNNEAVALANAGLWQDASLTLVELNSDDPTVVWNQVIVGIY
ncbi:MAG: hypothetical protein AAF490_23820, partial [Chloroflexota bacterium]